MRVLETLDQALSYAHPNRHNITEEEMKERLSQIHLNESVRRMGDSDLDKDLDLDDVSFDIEVKYVVGYLSDKEYDRCITNRIYTIFGHHLPYPDAALEINEFLEEEYKEGRLTFEEDIYDIFKMYPEVYGDLKINEKEMEKYEEDKNFFGF